MWQHGEEALAKALVASKLYRAMAKEAADDDLDVGVYEEMRQYSAEFDKEALDLLDYSYRQVRSASIINQLNKTQILLIIIICRMMIWQNSYSPAIFPTGAGRLALDWPLHVTIGSFSLIHVLSSSWVISGLVDCELVTPLVCILFWDSFSRHGSCASDTNLRRNLNCCLKPKTSNRRGILNDRTPFPI